jgi:hypothetical protein
VAAPAGLRRRRVGFLRGPPWPPLRVHGADGPKTVVTDIHGFVAARGLELVHFAKGQRKDDLAQEFLAKFTDDEGVLFVED